MAGADTVLRIIGAVIALMVVGITMGVGYQVLDPFYLNMDRTAINSLGWADGSLVMEFVGLGLLALAVVVSLWMWVVPIRDDVRQDLERFQ